MCCDNGGNRGGYSKILVTASLEQDMGQRMGLIGKIGVLKVPQVR